MPVGVAWVRLPSGAYEDPKDVADQSARVFLRERVRLDHAQVHRRGVRELSKGRLPLKLKRFAGLAPQTVALMRKTTRARWFSGLCVLFRRENGRLDLWSFNDARKAHEFAGNVGGIVPHSR